MWYYIKQAFLPFVYLIFMAMTAFGVLCIDADVDWLKYILLALNVGLYGVIIFALAYKDGQQALKVRIANDIERREIIRTGEDRPLKLKEEYKVWKGFMSGAIACVPLVILTILHAILYFTAGPQYNGAGAIASFIYMMFSGFIKISSELQQWHYYFNLIAIPFLTAMTGIPYILGAKKIQLQQDRIKAKQRQIYGDDYQG